MKKTNISSPFYRFINYTCGVWRFAFSDGYLIIRVACGVWRFAFSDGYMLKDEKNKYIFAVLSFY